MVLGWAHILAFPCFVWFHTLVSCSLVNNAHKVSFGEVLGVAVSSGKGGAPSKALKVV